MKKWIIIIFMITFALGISGCMMTSGPQQELSMPDTTDVPSSTPTDQTSLEAVIITPSPTVTPATDSAPPYVISPSPAPSPIPSISTEKPKQGTAVATEDPASLPVITKNPTDETVEEGGSCWFIAKYENATTAVWHFVSPNGQEDLTYTEAQERFPDMEILNGMYSNLQLKNIPVALDAWKVYCQYENSKGHSNTEAAAIFVRTKYNATIDYRYNGTYLCNSKPEIYIKIRGDLDEYYVYIKEDKNDGTVTEWLMYGVFDESGIMEFNNCEKVIATFISKGVVDESKIVYEAGSGKLSYIDNGIYWEDYQENAGSGLFFAHQK